MENIVDKITLPQRYGVMEKIISHRHTSSDHLVPSSMIISNPLKSLCRQTPWRSRFRFTLSSGSFTQNSRRKRLQNLSFFYPKLYKHASVPLKNYIIQCLFIIIKLSYFFSFIKDTYLLYLFINRSHCPSPKKQPISLKSTWLRCSHTSDFTARDRHWSSKQLFKT